MSSSNKINNIMALSAFYFSLFAGIVIIGISSYKIISNSNESSMYLSLLTFISGLFIPSPSSSISNVSKIINDKLQRKESAKSLIDV